MSFLRMAAIVPAASITGSALLPMLLAATRLLSALNDAWGSTYRQWEPTCSVRICHKRWLFSFLWCNYSDGCKAMYRTLLGVSKEFVLIGCVLRKRSVFILYFTHPHLFNENKLRTHTLQSKVRYFHVTPIPSVLSRYPLGPSLLWPA